MSSEVDRALAVIRAGGLVAIPTETVYGLAAGASNEAAVRRIFAAKGRPADHPLIVHVARPEQLRDWERKHPGRVISIFSALTRVTPSHLLDRKLFDFANLVADGVPDPDGDTGFDAEPAAAAPGAIVRLTRNPT